MRILAEGNFLAISADLAAEIGLNESIMLYKIEEWANSEGEIRNGKVWVCKSIASMEKELPFWSKATISRIIKNLLKKSLVNETDFNTSRFNRKRWLSINYEKLSTLKSVRVIKEPDFDNSELDEEENETSENQKETAEENAEDEIDSLALNSSSQKETLFQDGTSLNQAKNESRIIHYEPSMSEDEFKIIKFPIAQKSFMGVNKGGNEISTNQNEIPMSQNKNAEQDDLLLSAVSDCNNSNLPGETSTFQAESLISFVDEMSMFQTAVSVAERNSPSSALQSETSATTGCSDAADALSAPNSQSETLVQTDVSGKMPASARPSSTERSSVDVIYFSLELERDNNISLAKETDSNLSDGRLKPDCGYVPGCTGTSIAKKAKKVNTCNLPEYSTCTQIDIKNNKPSFKVQAIDISYRLPKEREADPCSIENQVSEIDNSQVIGDSFSDEDRKVIALVADGYSTFQACTCTQKNINNNISLIASTLPIEIGERDSKTQYGERVNNPEMTDNQESPALQGAREEKAPTNREIIAELVRYYRQIEGISPEPGDYPLIGRMYNEFGYDKVLEAINELGYRIENGFMPQNPKIYLLSMLKRRNAWGNASGKPESLDEETEKAVREVFEHYVDTFSDLLGAKITLTELRKRKIAERLQEGYTVEDIKLAIDNIRCSQFHCGQNKDGLLYATIEFICASNTRLEEWMNKVTPEKRAENETYLRLCRMFRRD